ncbi:unnamed protein product [Caenorhabditis sp. 36 PRJEB53466]|nr:unnamed protein product [Caenorhabditis sp. 36 PRJEB53466]
MSKTSKSFPDYYQFGRVEFVLVVNDVANLDANGRESDVFSTGDVDWYLNVGLNKLKNGKALSAFIYCKPLDVASAWKVDGEFRIVLEDQEDEKQSIARQMCFSFQSDQCENRGWNNFLMCSEALDEERGFVKDGALSFRVMIGVSSIDGFDSPKYFNFTVDDPQFSDTILAVDEFKFHVNKMIISVHSPVLAKLMSPVENGTEIYIENVDRQEFEVFLQLLYAVPVRIQKSNVAGLLEMAIKFETYGLKLLCEEFLKYAEQLGEMTALEVVQLAGEHRLNSVVKYVLNFAKSAEELKEKFENFEGLSAETIREIAMKTLSFA